MNFRNVMSKTTNLLMIGVFAVMISLIGSSTEADAAAFMKIDGIDGEATDKKHKGEIDILAWSWGMSQSDSRPGGGAGQVAVQDLSFTKYVDKSSTRLYQQLSNGESIPTVELSKSSAKYSGSEPYLIYTLTNVLVTSVSTGGSGGEDRLTENVTLNFEEIKVTYQAFDNKKKSGPPMEFTLDLEKFTRA
jgi:type VI secretion system secreted protein Hcp